MVRVNGISGGIIYIELSACNSYSIATENACSVSTVNTPSIGMYSSFNDMQLYVVSPIHLESGIHHGTCANVSLAISAATLQRYSINAGDGLDLKNRKPTLLNDGGDANERGPLYDAPSNSSLGYVSSNTSLDGCISSNTSPGYGGSLYSSSIT